MYDNPRPGSSENADGLTSAVWSGSGLLSYSSSRTETLSGRVA